MPWRNYPAQTTTNSLPLANRQSWVLVPSMKNSGPAPAHVIFTGKIKICHPIASLHVVCVSGCSMTCSSNAPKRKLPLITWSCFLSPMAQVFLAAPIFPGPQFLSFWVRLYLYTVPPSQFQIVFCWFLRNLLEILNSKQFLCTFCIVEGKHSGSFFDWRSLSLFEVRSMCRMHRCSQNRLIRTRFWVFDTFHSIWAGRFKESGISLHRVLNKTGLTVLRRSAEILFKLGNHDCTSHFCQWTPL